MTLKRPEKHTGIDAECEEGRIWNQAVTEYDAYLADLLKELRETWTNGSREDLYDAIRNLIGRVDHET